LPVFPWRSGTAIPYLTIVKQDSNTKDQEATISPAFVYVTSMWYTRDEIPSRTGVWFAGNSCGGFVASLLAYGIGQISHPLHPWQWMFIVSFEWFK
jgi:MFS family permease